MKGKKNSITYWSTDFANHTIHYGDTMYTTLYTLGWHNKKYKNYPKCLLFSQKSEATLAKY